MIFLLVWSNIHFLKKTLKLGSYKKGLEMDPIFQKILSGDVYLLKSALNEITHLRDKNRLNLLVEHIDSISEAATLILDNNSTLFSFAGSPPEPVYHFNYQGKKYPDFAFKKLEFVKNREGCLCELYPISSNYAPIKEEENGNIVSLSKVEGGESRWDDYYLCKCSLCESEYKVFYREYHGPWYEWKKI